MGKTVVCLGVFFVLLLAFSSARPAGVTSNTKLGRGALVSKPTGGDNTAVGFDALELNTTGRGNTAVGSGALLSNNGDSNTAIGGDALGANTTGDGNTAVGTVALQANTGGGFNTALGQQALRDNTAGGLNTAVGFAAHQHNDSGGSNTAVGHGALFNSTGGDSNTAVGDGALDNNTTGSNNTAIGRDANVSTGALTNATAIGNGAVANASNKVRVGNASVTVIEGQVAFTASSDATKKENFRAVDGGETLKKIRGFNLTSWNFIGHDPKEFRHYGPMAQDFFAAFGNYEIGTIGTPTTINSGDLAGILMIAVQALEKQNRELKARLEILEEQAKERPSVTASVQPR